MATQQNPISRGMAAIVNSLTAWPALAALVKVAGPNLDNPQRPGYLPRPANETQPNARPEIRVGQRSIQKLTRNSRGIYLTINYRLEISTSKYGPDQFNLLYIVILQALESSGNLGIPDILTDFDPMGGSVRQVDPRSGQPEWSGVCDVSLVLSMTRDTFLATTFT